MVFHGKINLGRHRTVGSNENIPNGHTAGNSKHVVFGPVARNKGRFTQDRQEDCTVQGGSPDPVTCNLAISLDEISVPEEFCPDIEDDGVIEGVGNPLSKRL